MTDTDLRTKIKAGRFRKKPVVVDAWRWGFEHWPEWAQQRSYTGAFPQPGHIIDLGDKLEIWTLEGRRLADHGDWVIRGVKGEIYPCKPDIFEATYEPAELRPKAEPVTEERLREVFADFLDELRAPVTAQKVRRGIITTVPTNWVFDFVRRVAHCNSPETE